MRAYIQGQPVATMHLRMTKSFVATGITVWANGVPMTADDMDFVGYVLSISVTINQTDSFHREVY